MNNFCSLKNPGCFAFKIEEEAVVGSQGTLDTAAVVDMDIPEL